MFFVRFIPSGLDLAIRNGWMYWNCPKSEQFFNKEGAPEIPLNVNYHIAYYEGRKKK